MKKKVCALLLTAAMMTCGLAGCGSTDANVGSSSASTPAQSSAASADSDQAADPIANLIAATNGTVELTVWASEEDQDLTKGLIADFEAAYPDVDFNITLGAESESTCKDTVLVDIEAAADVFTFADDQINDLVNAGALQAVSATYTYDVATANAAGAVEAASVNDTLYAYPMTADNGYFMFYDKSIFSEEDVQSLEKMLEVAGANNKKVAMCVSDGWYIYSFFKGAGYEMKLNDDGQTNTCNWNDAGATDVAQSIMDLFATGSFVNMTDQEMATAIAEGTIAACVNGTWRAADAAAAWGDNYAATKLPTFKVAGTDTQMASFSGCKLVGVNPHSDNLGWSMLLAEYLTSEASQVARFETRGLGPANISAASSDAVQADPAIAALAEQAAFATPQRVGGNYWAPAQTLGQILSSGNPDGTALSELLDTAVSGITAPVE